jgi:hypothetical protein
LSPGIKGQDVLLEREVSEDMFDKDFGQNQKKFSHLFVGLEFIVDEDQGNGLDINLIRSNVLSIGYRYKRKLTEIYAVGFELGYQHHNFNIKQNEDKTFLNPVLHDKEQLILNNSRVLLYQRFNFGRRGDFMGNFIDLGGYLNWTFHAKHQIMNEKGVPAYLSGKTEIIHSDLEYINPFHYGISVRVGFNRYAIVVNYRLNNILKSGDIDFPTLPSLSFGFQLGLH